MWLTFWLALYCDDNYVCCSISLAKGGIMSCALCTSAGREGLLTMHP